MPTPQTPPITLVIMTRNRLADLRRTLGRLADLPGRPPIIVADNGSDDGTVEFLRGSHPDVHLLPFGRNLGIEARNVAVRAARTPYVAFNDDDSWWEPGALARVVEHFEAHPALGALTAHVVVEPSGRDDPTSLEMRHSPLDGDPALPGVPVLGFLACATAVRRSAFLEVGGFESRLHFAGEETVLAIDLATAGWEVRFDPDLRIHHQASTSRDPAWRQRRDVRNGLWSQWLRRPAPAAAAGSWRLLRDAPLAAAVGGGLEALARGGWVWRARSVVPGAIEDQLRRLDVPRAAQASA